MKPLCWRVLWWQLDRLIRWYETWRPENVLYGVNGWGIVTVHYTLPGTDPSLYRPVARTFRPLSDPSWGSNLPACLEPDLFNRYALILPRITAEVSPKVTEGAIAPPQLKTS